MENETHASRRAKVLALLSDHRYHSTVEIECAAVGGSQGTRRLRELRAAGHTIVKRRKMDSTQYEYRLLPPKADKQQELF